MQLVRPLATLSAAERISAAVSIFSLPLQFGTDFWLSSICVAYRISPVRESVILMSSASVALTAVQCASRWPSKPAISVEPTSPLRLAETEVIVP